jgi:hypothetical protein
MFFTIWVTPEGRLAKLNPSRLFCFTAGFSGSPDGGAAKLSSTLFDYVHGSGDTLQEFPIPKANAGIRSEVEQLVQRLSVTAPSSERWRSDRAALDDAVYSIYGFNSREKRTVTKLSCQAVD